MFEAFVPIETVLPEKHFDDKPQKETTANETPGKKDPVEGKIVQDGRYARPRIRSLIQELSGKVIPKRKF